MCCLNFVLDTKLCIHWLELLHTLYVSVSLKMERRFQSQLQNMKDRLEQSDSTNRSLQNYVHFLKTSYGNVFGDSLLAS